ncbi:MAG: hypothetical protein ACKVJ7_07865, partial [Candidatus Poseidoniales archaeon]
MDKAVFLAALVLLTSLSGCFGAEEEPNQDSKFTYYPDINDRQFLEWEWNGTYSMVLDEGPHTALD